MIIMNGPNLDYEKQFSGVVAGIDEAGRGPLVGPVIAAIVVVDQNNIITGINDSKKISEIRRQKLYDQIIKAYPYAIGSASIAEIEQINILEATKLAMQRAFMALTIKVDQVLVDGNLHVPIDTPVRSIIRGDQISMSIAAASIVAKVYRDQIMRQLHQEYPLYNWQKNKGYGTKEHLLAIAKHGVSKYHRNTFAPIKTMLDQDR